MIYTAATKFSKHTEGDWCHLCGSRRYPIVDVTYARNAERPDGSRPNYLRMCSNCAHSVLRVAAEPNG